MDLFKFLDFEWDPDRVDEFAHSCSLIVNLRADEFYSYWADEAAGLIRSAGQLVREGKLNEAQFEDVVKCAGELSNIPPDLLFISWLKEEAEKAYKIRRQQAPDAHLLGSE